jgi:hypothetical protein
MREISQMENTMALVFINGLTVKNLEAISKWANARGSACGKKLIAFM